MKEIAKLIDEHGDVVFPYLQIWARYVVNGSLTKAAAISLIGEEQVKLLLDSEFIAESEHALIFEDQRGLLFLPKPPGKREIAENNFEKQLERIASIIGHPTDYYSKIGKYRAMFRSLLNSQTFDRIETIAYDNAGFPLERFLAPTVFSSLSRKFEAQSR